MVWASVDNRPGLFWVGGMFGRFREDAYQTPFLIMPPNRRPQNHQNPDLKKTKSRSKRIACVYIYIYIWLLCKRGYVRGYTRKIWFYVVHYHQFRYLKCPKFHVHPPCSMWNCQGVDMKSSRKSSYLEVANPETSNSGSVSGPSFSLVGFAKHGMPYLRVNLDPFFLYLLKQKLWAIMRIDPWDITGDVAFVHATKIRRWWSKRRHFGERPVPDDQWSWKVEMFVGWSSSIFKICLVAIKIIKALDKALGFKRAPPKRRGKWVKICQDVPGVTSRLPTGPCQEEKRISISDRQVRCLVFFDRDSPSGFRSSPHTISSLLPIAEIEPSPK